MEGRIVTNQTAEELQGVFFDADTFFSDSKMIYNFKIHFLSDIAYLIKF